MLRAARLALHRLAPLLLGAAVLHACDLPTSPEFPDSAVPLEPPAAYRAWWDLTAACAGVSGDFSRIRWYVVPGASSIEYGGAQYQGLWYRQGNRIVLAEQSVMRGALVRHEMLHALIARAGHPREYYRERCGGVVVCAGECELEAGSEVAASAATPRVLARELDLEVEIVASDPDPESGTGWVGVMVSVTNPHRETRVLRLGTSGARPPLPTFGYAVAAPGGMATRETYEFAFDTAMVFGPGETRRRLFDLWLPSREWEVRGLFDGGATSPMRFTIGR